MIFQISQRPANGWIDDCAVTLESLLAMRRAGADMRRILAKEFDRLAFSSYRIQIRPLNRLPNLKGRMFRRGREIF
jgi:hypothetical protein